NLGPNYFATMGIGRVAGREFRPGDDRQSPSVAIISESMARHFFGSRTPLGQRLTFPPEKKLIEIVGLVKDAKYTTLREAPPETVYRPFLQEPSLSVTLELRADTVSDQLVRSVRS